jgi:hypothetical protein
MHLKFGFLGLVVLGLITVFIGGAPGPDHLTLMAHATSMRPDNFWPGLWHGFTFPVNFVTGFFHGNGVYSLNNDGGWYNLGYLMGAGSMLGGATAAGSHNNS